ncbi:effector protein [Sinorhizobium medicae]|nr:effector protein [Sinorhizobium medicae]MDX0931684.1 effector protein [Sinorhizobium medicae]MDX1195697.1 effector protein [Sinorhizobium medicae]MDX1238338.1 effector protein [Sinorhizobium medicae]
MADIGKKPAKLRNPAYKQARSARREEEQRFQALETAQQARGELERPSKQKRYAKVMDIFDSVGEGYRGEVGYKLIGNKRLNIAKDGELTHKSGIASRKTEVLRRDPDSGSVYISRLGKEGWRKKRSYEFDAKGELHSLSRERKDGSFRERWERDETGNLIRTSYFTNRLQDGRIFRAISEELSAPYEGPNNKKYRLLTRRKGSKTEVFERDEVGNLELVERKARGFREYSTKSRDGRTKETERKSLFGSKTYQSLLDVNGNEVGRNIRSHRRLLNKRSAKFDEKTNQLTEAKHTVGKMYKSETRYLPNGMKVVSRKFFGVKLLTDLKKLTSDESKAFEMGAEEAAQHKETWKSVVVTPKLPSSSMPKQLGSAVAQLDGSGGEAHATPAPSPSSSPSRTSTAERPRSQTNPIASDGGELKQTGRRAIGTDAGQHDLNKPQPPSGQSKFDNDTFVDNANRRNARDANASSKQRPDDNLARIRSAIARTQADGDAALPHNEANPAGVKLQASSNQSSSDKRAAMILAAKRRDEGAKSAGL